MSTTTEETTTKTQDVAIEGFKTIQEGSSKMIYPADQEATVFYNPVQVQNRDLSVLMITLYAERRAVRNALRAKKKELRSAGIVKEAELKEKLKEYEATLDGAKLVKDQDAKQAQSAHASTEQAEAGAAASDSSDDGLAIMDALAASGLRSMRYWNEIPGVKHITINDLDEAAVERAKLNLKSNSLEHVGLESNDERGRGIAILHGDATHEMYMSRRPRQLRAKGHQLKQKTMWDVIDLDPYGSAAPFIDGAVQAVESGGLLCITCTDMAALGGSHPETAYGRYAGLPIRSSQYLQELALRLLLYTISVSAARYGRTIKPVLSVGMAFYVRVFIEINNDKKGVQDLSLNIGNVYQSTACPSFHIIPHGQMGGSNKRVYQSSRVHPAACEETGSQLKLGGPLWLGPLHDKDVVKTAIDRLNSKPPTTDVTPDLSLLATKQRLLGLLSSVHEELDTPLYYQLPSLSKFLHCSNPPLQPVMAAIINAGYEVSGYHKEPHAIKTTAPNSVIWDIMRAWIKKNPTKKAPKPDSLEAKVLAKEPSIDVDFTVPKGKLEERFSTNAPRFPHNPTKNWGPKAKGTGYKRKTDNESDPDPKRRADEDV